VTWLDLAEEQEMLAKAWTFRAEIKSPRFRDAALDDAADAAGQARSYRDAHDAGAPLRNDFAKMLTVTP